MATIDDFQTIPIMTREVLSQPEGVSKFITLDDDQLVMELNELPSTKGDVPFTPLENEYDMERRYRRSVNAFELTGCSRDTIAILTAAETIYFAAEIERVLPYPITILLHRRSDAIQSSAVLEKMECETMVLVAQDETACIPRSVRRVFTFNGSRLSRRSADQFVSFDVLTLRLIPWFALSVGGDVYATLDRNGHSGATDGRQFFLERSSYGTLLVTALCSMDDPGLIPIIRHDTNIPITHVGESEFRLVQTATAWR